MPKLSLAAVAKVDCRTSDNTMVVHGRSDKGKEVQISIPLDAFARLAAEAQRAAQVQKRISAGHLATRGDWAEVVPLPIRTVDVGSLVMETKPAVAVVLDRRLATEFAFPLSPEAAQDIGQKLIAESERCKSLGSPSKN